jgi:kynurenine 3-monooxygenase
MHYAERADYQQEFLEWGYKELTLPARADGRSAVELNALHVWPRGHCLIVTHPNLNGSHTCTLFLPFEGHDSFASIATGDDVLALFQKYFPDLVPMMPGLVEEWMSHPTGTLITTRTAPWHHRGRVVLVGDACHAVYPFYGQGMNAAFEDCSVLDRCIGAHPGDFEAAFAAYQAARKPHTDTLAELSKENFVELRQRVRSPLFMARKKADIVLNRLFPRAWLPLYTMISHTTMPYGDALARARTQDRLLGWLALGAGIVLMLLVGVAR